MNRILQRLAFAALIVATFALLWAVLARPRPETASVSAGVEELHIGQVMDRPRQSTIRGDPDSRIAIVEFSDFECPFCGRYSREIYPRLAEEYIETGEVQYVFRHYPLVIHPFAFRAAEAAECAARAGMFWEMHDLLFEAAGALTEADLLRYAGSLSLESADFETCLRTGAMAERVVSDIRDGEALGVAGTPTFFFAEVHDDGKLSVLAKMNGMRPYSSFKSKLDELIPAD